MSMAGSGFDRGQAGVENFLRKRWIVDSTRHDHRADQCRVRGDGLRSWRGLRFARNRRVIHKETAWHARHRRQEMQMAMSAADEPVIVAAVVLRAATAARPKVRYTAGAL